MYRIEAGQQHRGARACAWPRRVSGEGVRGGQAEDALQGGPHRLSLLLRNVVCC